MKLYFKYFALHLKSRMQYKTSFFLTIIGQFLTSFNVFLGIWFMFRRFNSVEGFTFAECLLCFSIVLMAFTLAECFFRGFDAFKGTVSQGTFDRILVRPRGTIVQVLEPGKKWTKIKDGKREGYIRTDCLKFLDAEREPIAMGDLSWRGTTTGGTRINVRNSTNPRSRVVGEWRTGTDVKIFSHEDGWYEVEAFNIHGFVMEEFVTIKDE